MRSTEDVVTRHVQSLVKLEDSDPSLPQAAPESENPLGSAPSPSVIFSSLCHLYGPADWKTLRIIEFSHARFGGLNDLEQRFFLFQDRIGSFWTDSIYVPFSPSEARKETICGECRFKLWRVALICYRGCTPTMTRHTPPLSCLLVY
jgi:hypothetical protein